MPAGRRSAHRASGPATPHPGARDVTPVPGHRGAASATMDVPARRAPGRVPPTDAMDR
ncbi:hypothetical protein Ae406Ps2_3654c [Pseudonocardia sp. Ae406_Ps2]|nr:hypothetical protein Ae406Ps2_3654c [Pseudonocardia sp. Ae406_Ps2]OLM25213.1 hypothetical protein Ae706Ps2_3646c [Pseudonocardia sp. Ae706_Ps2]